MGIRLQVTVLLAILASGAAAFCRTAEAPVRTAPPVDLQEFNYTHSDHFDLYLQNAVPVDDKTLDLLETVHDRFFGLMKQRGFKVGKTDSFTWICFNDRRSYESYARTVDGFLADQLNSYYSAKTNCVTVLTEFQHSNSAGADDQRPQTLQISASDLSGPEAEKIASHPSLMPAMLTHELIHQLSFNAGLQRRGVEYPLWVSEGLATALEYLFEEPGANEDNPYRLQTMLRLYRQNRVVPLNFFISMTSLSGASLTDTEIYAQCWAFFDFLGTMHKDQLRSYLVKAGRRYPVAVPSTALQKEFIDAFGPLEPLEAEWDGWLGAKDRQL
ncbi:MAG: DUF1570 domain-containing protein [Planctomycetaceae bacterium]|nr:DUF1570 domain-containing protein [Planctomycetaceae bacterium]